jgi:hypothetical protein
VLRLLRLLRLTAAAAVDLHAPLLVSGWAQQLLVRERRQQHQARQRLKHHAAPGEYPCAAASAASPAPGAEPVWIWLQLCHRAASALRRAFAAEQGEKSYARSLWP